MRKSEMQTIRKTFPATSSEKKIDYLSALYLEIYQKVAAF
ncbi:hypothetical protein AQPE_0588 [Aquipluma nitroreducens]|uniref:Mobile element protein n=1 Tax=Aquipluma nitroreducens TaxID=2010828 RepID=A0A5K7S4P4_9BACT|nr:hypothetical protein AQPE_0588 [Aquipluma nitroreducens]